MPNSTENFVLFSDETDNFVPLRILSNIRKIVLTEYTKSKNTTAYQFGYQWFVHRNERLPERYDVEIFDITA